MVVVPAQAVEREPVVGPLREEDIHDRLQSEDAHPTGIAGRAERVVALRAVDRDRVGRTVAAAVGSAEVQVNIGHVGARQVADHDVVRTAQGAELSHFDIIQIHADAGHIAVEQHPAAVGEDVDVLAGTGAEEEQLVAAVLALDRVAAVARVPLEDIVARAHQRQIIAVVAEDVVLAVAAEEHIGPL